jgi:hypothetical protein
VLGATSSVAVAAPAASSSHSVSGLPRQCSAPNITVTGDPAVVSSGCFGPRAEVTVDFFNADQYVIETLRARLNGTFSAPVISLTDVFVPEEVEAFGPRFRQHSHDPCARGSVSLAKASPHWPSVRRGELA